MGANIYPPAKTNQKAYDEGYDRIFGKKASDIFKGCKVKLPEIPAIELEEKSESEVDRLREENKSLAKQIRCLMNDECNKCQYYKDDFKELLGAYLS